jgi:ADP-heptose:LPS heptosyltransferase
MARDLGGSVLNLAGRTSLPVLGAVVRRFAVLLTNDSGPAHVAYALRTPAVVVFGSTDPARWGPLERGRHRVLAAPVPCRPCGHDDVCPIGLPCLENVTARQVAEAAEGVLRQRGPAS